MEKEKPLLSICIPTRNREFYCIEAIKNILSYPYDNYELVIQDNSDSDEIEQYVKANPDDRLVYNHDKVRINSAINMDKSLSMGIGEYILLLGDDDTILPSAFEVVKWAKKNDYNVVSPQQVETFFWNMEERSLGGRLILYKQNENTKIVKTKPLLKKLLKNGVLSYTMYNLPKVYHGLVKRTVLDEIRQKCGGQAVPGLSPDICLAIAIALLYDENVIINKPISIAGACPSSATRVASHKGHQGKLSDMPHLYNRPEYKWHHLVPPFYSVETTWAESALHTIAVLADEPQYWYKYYNSQYLCQYLNKKYYDLLHDTDFDIPATSIVSGIKLKWQAFSQKINIIMYAVYRRLIGRKEYQISNSWDEAIDRYNDFLTK